MVSVNDSPGPSQVMTQLGIVQDGDPSLREVTRRLAPGVVDSGSWVVVTDAAATLVAQGVGGEPSQPDDPAEGGRPEPARRGRKSQP